jgi:hypothetical protein
MHWQTTECLLMAINSGVLRRGKWSGIETAADPRHPLAASGSEMTIAPDIAMARAWYQTAKELGSVEASKRLDRLLGADR